MSSTNATCVICLQDFTNEDKKVCMDGCDHIIHSKCFFEYVNYKLQKLQDQVACPICRNVVINIARDDNTPILSQALIPSVTTVDNDNNNRLRINRITILLFIGLGANVLYLLHYFNMQN